MHSESDFDLTEVRHPERLTEILAEADAWQRILALPFDQILDVYLDLKSPHAYIAVRPSLEVMRDYRVRVNFLPYSLSYESFGITTRVEPDMKRRPPSAAADRKARMYYTTARRYSDLQGLPLRTPHRMLDSDLAHRAFLFARAQNVEVPFIMHVYLHGWGSGWRGYTLESADHLLRSLHWAGADTTDFAAFVADDGPGARQLAEHMRAADATGYAGVPHFVFRNPGTGIPTGVFGREHLALIRQEYHAAGLARDGSVVAEFSHAWTGPG